MERCDWTELTWLSDADESKSTIILLFRPHKLLVDSQHIADILLVYQIFKLFVYSLTLYFAQVFGAMHGFKFAG